VGLYREQYYDLNVRHFHEKLAEKRDIHWSLYMAEERAAGGGNGAAAWKTEAPSQAPCPESLTRNAAAYSGGSHAMGFADRVAADNERDGFFVVHCHAGRMFGECTVLQEPRPGCRQALRTHIDQTHVVGAESPRISPPGEWRSSPSQVSSGPK
jgi:hypothetical protein